MLVSVHAKGMVFRLTFPTGHVADGKLSWECQGPNWPDAIRQRDANFQFSKVNKTGREILQDKQTNQMKMLLEFPEMFLKSWKKLKESEDQRQ